MTYAMTRRLEIDAGHRIPLHDSKCRNIHGHRYVIEAICSAARLGSGSETGMVMDFSFLKDFMVKAIDFRCDHRLILSIEDPLVPELLGGPEKMSEAIYDIDRVGWYVTTPKPGYSLYLMRDHPTAENLALHWFMQLDHMIKADERYRNRVKLAVVHVHETPNCRATFSPFGSTDDDED